MASREATGRDSNGGQAAGAKPASSWGLGFIGLLFGTVLSQDFWGAVSGTLIGVLIAQFLSVRARLRAIEADLAALASRPASVADSASAAEPSAAFDPVSSPASAHVPPSAPPNTLSDLISDERSAAGGAPIRPPASPLPPAPSASSPREFDRPQTHAPAPPPPRPPRAPAPPSIVSRAFGLIRSFFFGGNTVVRVGLLVLLVGLTLLAKYAADNAMFPIEARLGFAALVGLGLVGFGFRQRIARPGFGMSLQGGGIAALYLITFFAFKLYGLMPAGLAFGLFVALALATVMLSLLQKSEPLVVIGSLGGFLAPVLASTGGGSHVALFSYYLLLITSIGLVAWRESWRLPGLVAFFCTYAVAGAWGVLRYEPQHYATTQPFVIAFMTLFTGIAFLHATRRKCELRGVIDGTLVFGTALISILIQGALVRERELGLALSAGGFGVFYMAWALLLWRKSEETFRPLAEAFLALAVGFATMAIPFAFDEALTTSVAWALEGAGLYWVGIRQSRVLPRVAGFALQVLGAAAFVVSVAFDHIDTGLFWPIANGRALSCLALALAGVVIARLAYVARDALRPFETVIAQGFGIVGLLWWTGGSLAEIEQFLPIWVQLSAVLLWIATTVLLLELGSVRFDWAPGRMMALASLPAAALTMLVYLDTRNHLLADGGWLAWPVVFASFYFLWERLKAEVPGPLLIFRAGCTGFAALFAGCALAGVADEGLHLATDWSVAGFGAGLVAVLFGGIALDARHLSPMDREPENARRAALGPVAGAAFLTIVGTQFAATGDASPIPHLPLLNPIDLVVCLLALGVFAWWRVASPIRSRDWGDPTYRLMALVFLAVAFFCLNGVLVRAVHQWTGVALDPDRLWDSVAMQVTLSIAWTVVGLLGMLLSSRRGWRAAWMGFAGLLAVVVLKLFTVDLSQLSTVARIGTFLAVGAMLLVLGYLSPVPPGRGDEGMGDSRPDPSSAAHSPASSTPSAPPHSAPPSVEGDAS